MLASHMVLTFPPAHVMQLETQVLHTTPTWTVLTQPLSCCAAGAAGVARGLPANSSLQHQVVNPVLKPTANIDPLSCCAVLQVLLVLRGGYLPTRPCSI